MANPKLEQEPTGPYFGTGLTTICPDCKENPNESGRRVQYIVVNGDFTFSPKSSFSDANNKKQYAESIRSFFIAAIWHYTKLKETNDALPEHQREDIRIVGWKSPSAPTWTPYPAGYTSESAGKKEIESWNSWIDSAIAPIQSLNDLVRALKSPAISAVHYFSHGEERSLSFKKDYKSKKEKIEIEDLRDQLQRFSPDDFPGKFTSDAKFIFYSCWAGRWDLTSVDDALVSSEESKEAKEKRIRFEAERDNRMQSVAAAFAQLFGISAYGSPFSIKLTVNHASSNICQYSISETAEDKSFATLRALYEYPELTRIRGQVPVKLYNFQRYRAETSHFSLASSSPEISSRFLGREPRESIDMPPHFELR